MTDRMDVTEADRDAASDWFKLTNSLGIDHTGKAFEKALRDGSYDDDHHPLVQAFARHRLAEQSRLASAGTTEAVVTDDPRVAVLREALEAVELARMTDTKADWLRATKLTRNALAATETNDAV